MTLKQYNIIGILLALLGYVLFFLKVYDFWIHGLILFVVGVVFYQKTKFYSAEKRTSEIKTKAIAIVAITLMLIIYLNRV